MLNRTVRISYFDPWQIQGSVRMSDAIQDWQNKQKNPKGKK